MSRRDPDFVDLRQPFYNGMPHVVAAGAPQFRTRTVQRPSDDNTDVVTLTDLAFSTHVGTHIDVPRHVFAEGQPLENIRLDAVVGPGAVVDLMSTGANEITAVELEEQGRHVERGDIILLATGWASRYRDASYVEHPYLSGEAAEWLVERGPRLVAIDTLSPEMPDRLRPPGYGMPVHRMLLGKDILIIENLGDAAQLVGRRVHVSAVPMLIEAGDGAPVAVYARDSI